MRGSDALMKAFSNSAVENRSTEALATSYTQISKLSNIEILKRYTRNIYTYIPLILYPRKGSREISDHHHHRSLTLLSDVGTRYFLLPLSSITRHLHAYAFYFHVILHTVSSPILRSTLRGCPSTFILITLFVM
jgi:hypothetical protein